MATAGADPEGDGKIIVNLSMLQSRLLAIGAAIEAGDQERALNLLAELLGIISSGRGE